MTMSHYTGDCSYIPFGQLGIFSLMAEIRPESDSTTRKNCGPNVNYHPLKGVACSYPIDATIGGLTAACYDQIY